MKLASSVPILSETVLRFKRGCSAVMQICPLKTGCSSIGSSPSESMKCSLFFTWALVAIVFMVGQTVSTTKDEAALVSFKEHLTADSQSILAANWSLHISVCNWIGVTCDSKSGSVIALNLSSMGLNGTISPHIGNLSSVRAIDLSYNGLSGRIPSHLWTLTMLSKLYLARNSLEGPISSSIGNCTLLEEINLSENNLTGAIPNEIGNLQNLEAFKVNNNILSGLIPSTLFNISTIKVINLRVNNFSGSLAPNLGLFLPNLLELLLQQNKLHGEIPASISNSSRLTSLDLSYNSFTSSTLNMLSNLRSLQKLDLAYNYFTGGPSAPESNFISSLGKCRRLKRLVLSGNSLNINLPSSIGNLSTSLEILFAEDCKLRDHIPAEVGNLSGLIGLELGINGLVGTIPGTIGKLEKLQVLRLQNNRLQGVLSSTICNLNSLEELTLGRNGISGSIPECLGNLTSLRTLDLSSNRFIFTIPSSLFRSSHILALNMSSNSLDGPLPSKIGDISATFVIDFSKNQLSGVIPDLFWRLESLIHLSLAENRLHGPMPSYILRSNLEVLDLSRNNLSGKIPRSMEGLRYLRFFNVSVNSLEGEIPSGGPFQYFTAESYIGNKALCGAPRLHVPRCKSDGHRNGHRRSSHWKLILLLPSLFCFSLLCCILIMCRKRLSLCFPMLMECCRAEADPLLTTDRRIRHQEIVLATDGFSENKLLGAGSYATVYKGALREEKNVAIKVFDVQFDRGLRSFEVEYQVMRITRHRNLVKLINSCCASDFKALVLEYMPNGDLDKWLHRHNYFLTFLQRLDIMIDVALAVNHLHSNRIIHCDLKPANILLDEDMVARISDFSISKILGEGNASGQTTTLGTFGYMAPEYGSNGTVSEKTDVYSFGIMLIETFTTKKPTDEMFDAEMSLKNWVFRSLPDAIVQVLDVALIQTDQEEFAAKINCILRIMKLAYSCTSELPSERLCMIDILEQLQMIKAQFLRLVEL